MNNYPLVSVITSVLNAGRDLEDTFKSMPNWGYNNIEYIVIDGASSDSTRDVLFDYRSCISKIVSESDTGIYDAWNKGLKLATGDYIAFLGAGDYYLNSGLSKLVSRALINSEADFISSRIAVYHDSGEIIIEGAPWKWSNFRRYMNVDHPGALHSRRLFDLYGIFDESFKIAGDYEFLLRAGEKLNADFISDVTLKMRAGGVSQVGVAVFKEVERAKIKNGSVPMWLARIDRYYSEAKKIIKDITPIKY